ncbi:MAG: aldehyde ferredoxin oxidoreductase [Promethearchaeota archaeon]
MAWVGEEARVSIPREDRQLLRVDLTGGDVSVEEIPEDLLRRFVGGKGLGTYYLLKEVPPRADPLGPENELVFVAGPVTATKYPTGNRYGIIYKSPLTGTFAESYSGGGAVQLMRAAGYFVVLVEGAAERPTCLHIHENGATFRDATPLWGKDTIQTYEYYEAHKRRDVDVLCIGPAGENLVRIANVQNNLHHSAGRCGPGAVMGAKKLKALIFTGSRRPSLDSSPAFQEVVREVRRRLKDKPEVYGKEGLYPRYGTPSIVDWANELGCFPTRYFTACWSEHHEEFNAEAIRRRILKKRTACWNCPFGCGKRVVVDEGEFQCSVEGPEYETIYAFAGLCDVRDVAAVAWLNEYCDRAGIDTISAGSLCGLAIEANRRGRLPVKLELDYNQPKQVFRFLDDLVHRRGIGDAFADGTKAAAERFGLQDLAMHVKGLDFAGYDPRAFRGFTLSYGVSPEGPTHLRSVFHGVERNLPNRLSYEGKVEPMIAEEDRMALIDSLVVCKFIRGVLDWDLIVRTYNAVFGTTATVEDLRGIANEVVTMARRFNAREGFSRKDDYMPPRAYEEPVKSRSGVVHVLDRDAYDRMLDEYYERRGWSKDGVPRE